MALTGAAMSIVEFFRTGVWVSGKRHTEPVCGQTDGDTAVNLDVQVWQETV
jgi:hypothetical protein